MKQPIIVIGLGELGSVFARGFLRLGYPVQGVTRDMDIELIATEISDPTAVLVAVGEADIAATLNSIPATWKDKLILLQNELLPRDWQAAAIEKPTVISVWFEKKKGMDSKVVLPSPIYGPNAKLVFEALSQVDLPSFMLDSEDELSYELVRKNLYILTTNIAGLEVGGQVEALMNQHAEVMNAVANDVLDIQDWLTNSVNDREKLMQGLIEAINGDLQHGCMGRSAPSRLARAIKFADQAGLKIDKLRQIAANSK
jgi:ketopantoate reductase